MVAVKGEREAALRLARELESAVDWPQPELLDDYYETVDMSIESATSFGAVTALRLSRYFDTTERFWLSLQARYDLETAKERLGPRLDREVVRRAG